jgi:heme A synthase
LVLLVLGQLVTSFQAGMADPIWPTEPWYLLLIDWQEPSPGYLIEHSHRIAGFVVGGMTAVLALGLWWTHPARWSRWGGLIVWLVWLTAYGQFHAALMAQRQMTPEAVQWPQQSTWVLLVAALLSIAQGAWDVGRQVPGAPARLLALLALAAVMIQGLLGGFRVLWDALAGTNLAAVHGVFAQCVLGLVLLTAIWACVPAPQGRFAPGSVGWWRIGSVLLAAGTLTQIALGAWLRHHMDPWAQRGHILAAFVVFGGWVVLGTVLVSVRDAWNSVRYLLTAVIVVLATQLYLGVEAWLVRYGAGVPPELAPNTVPSATWRTAHALVGSLLWALTLAHAVHWWRYQRRAYPVTPTNSAAERTPSLRDNPLPQPTCVDRQNALLVN